jgi:hypothetical protein
MSMGSATDLKLLLLVFQDIGLPPGSGFVLSEAY